jgi:hypothetical protein
MTKPECKKKTKARLRSVLFHDRGWALRYLTVLRTSDYPFIVEVFVEFEEAGLVDAFAVRNGVTS